MKRVLALMLIAVTVLTCGGVNSLAASTEESENSGGGQVLEEGAGVITGDENVHSDEDDSEMVDENVTVLNESINPQVEVQEKPTVSYSVHVQNAGWQNAAADGETAGTTGKSLRLEAIKMKVSGVDGLGINYRSHVQNVGWQSAVSDGAISGTEGKSLRLEAIEVSLTGVNKDNYDVYYRVHSQQFGWLDWAVNGEKAGTAGYSYRIEALQIVVLSKESGEAPTNRTNTFYEKPKVVASSHVQSQGWKYNISGDTIGTTGKSLRVEAFGLKLSNAANSSIEYTAHLANIGWMSAYKADGATAGTTGQSRAVEAVKIRLKGDIAQQYNIYYRAHVAHLGWLDWASNDAVAGSVGFGYAIEAIQYAIVPKVKAAPGTTTTPYCYAPTVNYLSYVRESGWTSAVTNGGTAGTTGQSKKMEAVKMSVADIDNLGIQYSTHVSNVGWTSFVNGDEVSGQVDAGKQVEAIKIKLTGYNSKHFNVWYRVYSASYGWLGWTSNGNIAGTTAIGYAAEAIQVVIRPKGTGAPGSTKNPYMSHTGVQLMAYNKLNQVGWDLKSAFNWSSSIPYYRNVPSVPSGQKHTEYYANYGFTYSKGNCYVMAATFCQMAKLLGYEAYLVEGVVPKSGGGVTPHGWCEVVMNGTVYVCDPDFQYATGRNGYMFAYRTSGTWVYQSYKRVN